jgi:hypothetical protein
VTPVELSRYLTARLPTSTVRRIDALSGGAMNLVWRVDADPRPLIVKQALAYVVSAPQIPVDPRRLSFEATALRLLAQGGGLASVASAEARAPAPLLFDEEHNVLIMEDLGPHPHLGAWLASGGSPEAPAHALGGFMGRLHGATDAELPRLDNASVQTSRQRVQYGAATLLLTECGIPDAAALGARAAALGRQLLLPGRCFTMGDLWPPSVLVFGDEGVGVIDWEFSHYGDPAQDLGHLAAHLWMLSLSSSPGLPTIRNFWRRFLAAYRGAAAVPPEAVVADCAVHFACELLMRSVGPFAAGFPLFVTDPHAHRVSAAVERAAHLLRHADEMGSLEALVTDEE